MSVATPIAVQTLLGRELTPEESAQVPTLLAMVERRISRRVSDFDTRIETDDSFIDAVVDVEALAVTRVLNNPDGFRSETAGGVSYTIDSRVAAGFITILDEEWTLLGVSKSSGFSVAPVLGGGLVSPSPLDWS